MKIIRATFLIIPDSLKFRSCDRPFISQSAIALLFPKVRST
ncbi:hypothetical protein [Microcoleus sp. CAWBG640]